MSRIKRRRKNKRHIAVLILMTLCFTGAAVGLAYLNYQRFPTTNSIWLGSVIVVVGFVLSLPSVSLLRVAAGTGGAIVATNVSPAARDKIFDAVSGDRGNPDVQKGRRVSDPNYWAALEQQTNGTTHSDDHSNHPQSDQQ